jgi:RHS repeat-associated protein
MKTRTISLLGLLAFLSPIFAPHLASAHYDPSLQRWISRDPLGEPYNPLDGVWGPRTPRPMPWEGADGPNLFQFARNSPTTSVDPHGESIAVPVILGCIGTAIVLYELYEGLKAMCHGLYVAEDAALKQYQKSGRTRVPAETPPVLNPELRSLCVKLGMYK